MSLIFLSTCFSNNSHVNTSPIARIKKTRLVDKFPMQRHLAGFYIFKAFSFFSEKSDNIGMNILSVPITPHCMPVRFEPATLNREAGRKTGKGPFQNPAQGIFLVIFFKLVCCFPCFGWYIYKYHWIDKVSTYRRRQWVHACFQNS